MNTPIKWRVVLDCHEVIENDITLVGFESVRLEEKEFFHHTTGLAYFRGKYEVHKKQAIAACKEQGRPSGRYKLVVVQEKIAREYGSSVMEAWFDYKV